MVQQRTSALLPILLLCACSHPDAFPPPPQVVMPSGPEPAAASENSARPLLAMSDPDADAHILRDVPHAGDDPDWRFTGPHPKFRLELQDVSHLVFYVRFFNHREALLARGPVTLAVDINGKQFHSERFAFEGDVEFRRPLPDGFIAKPGPVEVSLDISPPWHYPGDGTVGVLLHSIGFQQAEK
ncbi:MAG TPA: hypothetical protein VEU96_23525 [Bryobacteraceae bacterium]|nr:hypothetical protein [Bryobacteraceae bacterium]